MGKKRVLSNEEYHSNLENSIKSEFFPTLLTNSNNTNDKIIPIDKLTSNYINKDKNELNLLLEQDKLNLRSSKPWLFKKGDEINSIDKDIKLIEYTKSIDKTPDPDLKLVTTSTKTSYSKKHYPFKNSKKINKPETIISNTNFKNDILNNVNKNEKQNSNKLKIEKNYDMIPPKKLTKDKNEITKRIIRNSLGLNK
ncbi:unnamed protein product [[Candida] boidinii]|uniref:Unnamed protein product n=1 Tax=Candida boidinii TaxID=5477 RepID=A0A9W6T481_CANBO|nr:hypothetical protein B5S30_g4758 [[Candida] boidinii]OWB86628.1 hypothetical protein B5S33_g5335 [[Candida] boidinii]GME76011.1 unnamed protein product [[Candida] boidinii]